MKLFSALRAPAWEQRDPVLRAEAVRQGEEPELLARLAQIARQDSDPGVRRAALARLQDPAVLREALSTERDAATREAALSRLSRLLLDAAAGLALETRLALVRESLPGELLERVAETAPEPALRRAALERISRPALLARRCAEETDAGLREWLLTRLEGEDVLERLAESLRRRDKHLARLARDRVTALRLARGDATTLQQWALGLCDELTAWAQALPHDIATRRAAAENEWTERRTHFDEAMQRRVQAYFERVDAALAQREELARRRAARATEEEAAPQSAPEPVSPEVRETNREVAARAEADTFAALDELLKRAERGAAQQLLGEARPAYDEAAALYATLPRGDRARRERLVRLENKLEELAQWQRWSGNRVRARLCEEVEALIAAAPHPDAVAHRVRELQQEWARIEAAEPGDADRSSGLARRFRALCTRAMAPTRPYFEKRHALREQRRAELETLLGEIAGLPSEATSVPHLVVLRRRAVEALRQLDEIDPRARTSMARRLREALARLDAALAAQREDAALTRRRLLARLRRDLTHADASAALTLARDAQAEWRTLPRAAREQEEALAQELAGLIDPLFARERGQREQRDAEATRLQDESRRILAELEALAASGHDALAHADGRIAALTARWRELQASVRAEPEARDARREADRSRPQRESGARGPGRERGRDGGRSSGRGAERGASRADERGAGHERAFDQAVARVREAQQVQERQRRGVRLQTIVEAVAVCGALEAGLTEASAAAQAWDAIGLDEADRRRLQARFERARGGAPVSPDSQADAQAERWLVEAELDANLDSPDAVQALRRQCQMQRLAVRLQGAVAAATEPRERLLDYAMLGPLDPARHEQRIERLRAVCAAWSRS